MRETTKWEKKSLVLCNLYRDLNEKDPYEMRSSLIDKIEMDQSAELNYELLFSYFNHYINFDTDFITVGGTDVYIRDFIDNVIFSALYIYYTFGDNKENEKAMKECIEDHVFQHLLNLRTYLNSLDINPMFIVRERIEISKLLKEFIEKVINIAKDNCPSDVILNTYIQTLSKSIQKLIDDKNDNDYLKIDSKFKAKKLSLDVREYQEDTSSSIRLKTIIRNNVDNLRERFKDFNRDGQIEISLITRDSYTGDIYDTYDGWINYYFNDDDKCVMSINIDLDDHSLETIAEKPQLEVFAIIGKNVVDEDMVDKKYKKKYGVEYAYGNLYSPLGIEIWPENLNKLIMKR